MRQLHRCKRDRSYKKIGCSLLLIVRRRATRGLERQSVVQDSIQFSLRGKVRGKYTQDMTLLGGLGVVHPHWIFSSKITCSARFGLNSKQPMMNALTESLHQFSPSSRLSFLPPILIYLGQDWEKNPKQIPNTTCTLLYQVKLFII